MSLVRPAVRASPDAGDRVTHAGARARWLVLACYLLGAVALTVRLWADPAGRMQAGDPHDVDLFAWFMRYAATAVSHGRLPSLVTTSLNAPQGVSVMWNTSLLLPGVLLAPVTLLAGPQVSLTIVLTLGYTGSAASLFGVLSRWGASVPAAALGGAVYGFSPALVNSGFGHYQLAPAVLPPLMIDALLRIVTGRGSAVRAGAWLGLLAAAQVFIGEELLVDTALAGVLLVAVLAAQRPRAAVYRACATAAGLATAAAVTAVICGYALWVQMRGPLHEHSLLLGSWSGDLASFVVPPGQLLIHTSASAALANSFQPGGASEYLGYLGVPLLLVLPALMIRFRHDPKVRTAGWTFALLELCSLGGGTLVIGSFRIPGYLLPWHWLQGLPGIAQVMPDRFAILADGAAAALLAFSAGRLRSAAPPPERWRRYAPAAVIALAIVPVIPTPFPATAVAPAPAGWQAAFGRLRLNPDVPVLTVPVPILRCTLPMRWQADTGVPGSMVGGYFLGPDQTGQAAFTPGTTVIAARYLDSLWQGGSSSASSTAQLRSELARWRPAAIVAVTSRGSRLERVLAGLVGPPTLRVRSVLVWRL